MQRWPNEKVEIIAVIETVTDNKSKKENGKISAHKGDTGVSWESGMNDFEKVNKAADVPCSNFCVHEKGHNCNWEIQSEFVETPHY